MSLIAVVAMTMNDSPNDPADDPAGSMSLLLRNWSANENRIAERINTDYFPRLRRFAQRVLKGLPGAAAEADDVVQSAMKSLCRYMRHLPESAEKDREDIWRLLAHIAARKAGRRRQRQTRGLRDGRVVPITDIGGDDAFRLDELLVDVSVEEFDLSVQEALERVDESLRPIVLLTMEGRTQAEISDLLGCSRRTVIRKLDLARRILQRLLD